MVDQYYSDRTFNKTNLDALEIRVGEYENCVFDHIDFTGHNLSNFRLIDCLFQACNLSMIGLQDTMLQNARFVDCKMLGLRFDTCLQFGLSASFQNCQMNHSSFFKTKMKKAIFNTCSLQEVDFAACDLSEAKLLHCDLAMAIFDSSNLEKTDFSTAFNYAINPENNKIKKAKFSNSGLRGLLQQYNIVIVD